MLETFDKKQLLLPLNTSDNILDTSAEVGEAVVYGICIKDNKVYLVPLESTALDITSST